jgi:hypothetical protein
MNPVLSRRSLLFGAGTTVVGWAVNAVSYSLVRVARSGPP